MTGTCRRCGETSASFCEDWDCHLGWGEPMNSRSEEGICALDGCACGGFEHDTEAPASPPPTPTPRHPTGTPRARAANRRRGRRE